MHSPVHRLRLLPVILFPSHDEIRREEAATHEDECDPAGEEAKVAIEESRNQQ